MGLGDDLVSHIDQFLIPPAQPLGLSLGTAFRQRLGEKRDHFLNNGLGSFPLGGLRLRQGNSVIGSRFAVPFGGCGRRTGRIAD